MPAHSYLTAAIGTQPRLRNAIQFGFRFRCAPSLLRHSACVNRTHTSTPRLGHFLPHTPGVEGEETIPLSARPPAKLSAENSHFNSSSWPTSRQRPSLSSFCSTPRSGRSPDHASV